jgi:predicted AlkP superfamily phosphohydrolase/phosphomutase
VSADRPYAWARVALMVLAVLVVPAMPLQAYVGPGAGFAFLSSFLLLIGAFFLTLASLIAWPFRFIFRLASGRKAYRDSRVNRLVIVGLDGLDPVLAERFMAEGKLPNLSRLKTEGTFARLRTTTPAISPVAWSSFMTGSKPSKHNIFDFLSRDPRSYLPTLSSAQIGKAERVLSLGRYNIPLSKPPIRGMRKSVPFWKILGDRGIFCTVLRVPITFPPEKFKGHLLSGMCAPDLKGSQGTFSYYTSNPEKARAMEGGVSIPVTVTGNLVETHISGPENTLLRQPAEMRLPLRVILLPDGESAKVQVSGREYLLKKGEFSPWIRLTFKPGLAVKLHGTCRVLVSRVRPEFEMYVTPLNIDPERPALPISHPFYYSMYLSKLLGPFVTLGLADDTWALNEGALSEEAFLTLAYANHDDWERIFFNALSKTKKGALVCVFETTDSIQHMFFRYLDKGHPALRSGEGRLGAYVIEDLYKRMDDMVGRVRKELDDRSALVVMSDHGFKAFRRGVSLNTWFLRNGYQALKDGRAVGREWFEDVDWNRTKAYALGLGGVYLNLRGREARGIVAAGDEARRLKKDLIVELTGLRDDELGVVAINEVFDKDDIFDGPYRENAPDLIVGYAEGYRASWDSVKGMAGGEVFDDNRRPWSGDHCIDPKVVPGVLFCSHRLSAGDAAIWDIAPTALAMFGVPVPAHMDGRVLFDTSGPLTAREKDTR